MNNKQKPKVLFIDIETKPLLVWSWGVGDQYIGLEQIKEDWCIMSVAAKWADSKQVMQFDLREGISPSKERKLLKKVWKILDEADIVIGQNSKRFDTKKLNDRFLKHGLGKPSPFRELDTLVISKKYFSPTSHKLEYRSKYLNEKYKKSSHSKFPGLSLWLACIDGNQSAWKEMAEYNIFDVLATEEYFNVISKWDSSINLSVYGSLDKLSCVCGHTNLQKRGFNFSNRGKYQRYQCMSCLRWVSGKTNLLTINQRKNITTKS